MEKTTTSLKHMYLLDWDIGFETMPYPAATGIYAIYKLDNIQDHVNHAMQQVRCKQLQKDALTL